MMDHLSRLPISSIPPEMIADIETNKLGTINGYFYAHAIEGEFAFPYILLINDNWYFTARIDTQHGEPLHQPSSHKCNDDSIIATYYEILREKEHHIRMAIWAVNLLDGLNADVISVIKSCVTSYA